MLNPNEGGGQVRVCFLGDAGSIHLQRWIDYFVTTGYEVEVISFRAASLQGAKVHLLAHGSDSRLAYLRGLLKIRHLLKTIHPDILHAHYATSFGLLAVISRFHPLVVSAWGSDVLVAPQESAWLRYVVKKVLRDADALTSDSLYMSKRMEDLLEGKEKLLKTVTMGVSKEWFSGISSLTKNPWQILSLRGHHPIYNIDTIIRAMAGVIPVLPEANLVIAGEGPETPALKALVETLGIQDHVQFVGQLPHERVKHYLCESSISVSVPTSDATAVSLLETMACGAFPVVTDLPANREWIEEGINGLIVPAKDALALTSTLIKALQAPKLREQAVDLNRRKIVDKAIWENNMAEMETLYQKLLGEKS